MKKLSGLAWTPAWTSIVGCIKGALDYLKIAPDISWLFGATGHAFIINMSRDGSCPSGPTAWKTSRFYDLGMNLGYQIDGIWGDKRKPDFKELQQAAWELAKTSLDQDFPVIGWELAIPEFYLVTGYDDQGYYFSGPGADMGSSPKPWGELGDSGIGMLEVYAIKPAPRADTETQVREALAFALAFNQGDPKWVLPEYLAGQEAYRAWIDALHSGQAMLMGHAYNAAVWEECRRNGVAFLVEAKNKLKGRMDQNFDLAIKAYQETASQLKDVTELYPFFENNRQEPVGENTRSQKAAEHLQAAKKAEADGHTFLEEILDELS